jgi:hypothetical protein
MKNRFARRVFQIMALPAIVIIALVLSAAPSARAGLTFTIDMYRTSQGQTYVFYTPLATNAIAPAAALGTYVISSPSWPTNGSRRGFDVTAGGVSDRSEFDSENGYSDFNSAMQQITNGAWTILFTNATTTNTYTFTVSAPTLTSNMIPATIITYPPNGSINIPNQPTFTWSGPTNSPVNPNPYVLNYDASFFQEANIPLEQQYWTLPTPMPNGLDASLNLNYVSNYATSLFIATTPLNTNPPHLAISGWTTATTLETGDYSYFAVTNPSISGTILVAHYTFDDSGNLGADSSGNGYDLDFNGADGVASSGTAVAGGGAAYFDGFSFLSYTATPAPILNAFAGDFSLSFWINTTEENGNEGGPAYAGDGIVTADVPGAANDLVPAALDGNEIGFNTGSRYGDDTVNSTVDVSDGSYHHVVITRTEATGVKQIYIDGVLNTTETGTMNPLSDPRLIAIGCAIDASQTDPGSASISEFYQGLLDDVQIYAGVLSQDQVTQLHSNPGSTAVSSDFNFALNTTGLPWATSGDSSWFVENSDDNDGVAAAQSGSVTGSQSSTISVTVTGPGTLTFYWSCIANDSNEGFDYEFDIDGGYVDDIYGDTPWYQDGTPFIIPAGQHTLSWTTSAYGDTDPTQAGFLDQVNFVPDTAPVITVNPFNQTNYPGYNVALFAAATNGANAPITWHWFEVGNPSPITNATSALYIPTNSGTAGVAGSYYAVATTSGGSTPTTTAVVSFASAPLPPDWSIAVKSPFQSVDASVFNKDYYAGCTVDSAGEVYAAAQYYGSMDVLVGGSPENVLTAPGTSGAALIKHDATGNPIWGVGLTNNQTSSSSYGEGVALAPGNGAYLEAGVDGTNWLGTNKLVDSGNGSILVARFDANGSNLWFHLIGGTNGIFPFYNCIVSDASGNVTVAGTASGMLNFGGTNVTAPTTGQQGFLAQYDSNGVVRWVQIFPEWVTDVTSSGGRLYANVWSGFSAPGPTVTNSIGGLSLVTDRQWTIAALNATNGQALWLRGLAAPYGSHVGLIDDIPLLSVSGSNVFVIGTGYGSGGQFGGLSVSWPGGRGQYFARYDTNGNPQVASSFGSPTTTTWASAANASGIYVSGDFDYYSQFGNDVIAAPVYAQNDLGPAYFTQPFVAKFDTNGNPLWARNGVSSDLANFRGIATTSDGVWASGFLKITNSILAEFGTHSVYSDYYIVSVGVLGTIYYTQGGDLAKITEVTSSPSPVTLINPQDNGTNFQFQFVSQSGFSHTILYRTNLVLGSWQTSSNVTGDGTLKTVDLPLSVFSPAKQGYVRVTTQ